MINIFNADRIFGFGQVENYAGIHGCKSIAIVCFGIGIEIRTAQCGICGKQVNLREDTSTCVVTITKDGKSEQRQIAICSRSALHAELGRTI